MEIWLKHPMHGIKCAHLPTEAETDEKNGWIRFDPTATAQEKVSANAVESVESDAKRRGRPPKADK